MLSLLLLPILPSHLTLVPRTPPTPHPQTSIAAAIPYYAFKGIDRFYDISGLLLEPALFQRTVDILLERYKGMAIDKIGGCVLFGGGGGERGGGVLFLMYACKGRLVCVTTAGR